jgi:ATP-dependent DNA ligase
MEATLVAEIPHGDFWQYEPKWDGFRALIFRNGKHIELRSKSGQPLGRYFPELLEAVSRLQADRFVLDSEIVIPTAEGLSFDALLQRIHPAESRIRKLAHDTPAVLVLFDILVEAGKSLADLPLAKRRQRLEQFVARHLKKVAVASAVKRRAAIAPPPTSTRDHFFRSPVTSDRAVAVRWLAQAGATLDGVIAKRADLPYQSGNRDGMVKIKRIRTADCVVGGFRYATAGKFVGSILLGLYNQRGLLDHVGFCSSFKSRDRPALTRKLEKLIKKPGFTGNAPGGPSRWSTTRSTEWEPLNPELVVEVQYDHFTGGRFRHGTKFLRWRPEKSPRQCTMKQVTRESRASRSKRVA